jgi:hypothetical protein
MEFIKGRKGKRDASNDEEKFRFPVVEEIWEVTCGVPEEWEARPQLPTSTLHFPKVSTS